jgi:preprotein translocase subunit SecA
MARDPISQRFNKRRKDKDLEDRRLRGMTSDEIEAEEELIKGADKAQKLSSKDKPARNDPCPCGSGKKYKKCCGAGE